MDRNYEKMVMLEAKRGGFGDESSSVPCGPECLFASAREADKPAEGYEIPRENTDPAADVAERLYAPLRSGQTRILTLNPGRFGEPLVASLSTVNIHARSATASSAAADNAARIHYDALSYCWGADQEPRFLLRCGGEVLPVGGEAYRAMQRLRSPARPLRIWIDAICINQRDGADKALQIPLMVDIYRAADRVHVWLGEHDGHGHGHARLACLLMRSLGGRRKAAASLSREGGDGEEEEEEEEGEVRPLKLQEFIAHKKKVCGRHSKNLVDGFDELMRRFWFGRTWVIQEVWAAREILVHGGDVSFSWGMFKACYGSMHNFPLTLNSGGWYRVFGIQDQLKDMTSRLSNGGLDASRPPERDMQNRYLTQFGEEFAWDIVNVLRRTMGCKYTLVHDRIYGLLGMTAVPVQPESKDTNTYALEISYDQPVSELFRKVAMYIIKRDQCLSLLHFNNLIFRPKPTDEHQALELASWVPDWRRPLGEIAMQPSMSIALCGLSPNSAISFQEDADGSLRLRGFRVGVVTGGEKDELDFDCSGPEYLNYNHPTHMDPRWKLVNTTSALGDVVKQDEGIATALSSAPDSWAKVTDSPILSWLVPFMAQDGDVVVAVEGAWTPLLLRPLESSPGSDVLHYNYVGLAGAEQRFYNPNRGPKEDISGSSKSTYVNAVHPFSGESVREVLWKVLEARERVGRFEYFSLV